MQGSGYVGIIIKLRLSDGWANPCPRRQVDHAAHGAVIEASLEADRADRPDGADAADLGIHPAKLSDPLIRKETDGELFWKITVGKKPMPNYRTRLSPTDRWNVINYLRSLPGR